MPLLIHDDEVQEEVIADRRAKGLDRWDEVWEGVYVMPPIPNIEHQFIVGRLQTVLDMAIGLTGSGEVYGGANVSDRKVDWQENYRSPDVLVYLNGTKAEKCGAFWYGGPDFAIEVVSPKDFSRTKFEFYAKVGVRELLIVDRQPWRLELYRLAEGRLEQVGVSTPETGPALRSEVIPFSFGLAPGGARPQIEVAHRDGVQRWLV